MENVLQQQHVGMNTASDIMYNLADMFANQGRQARLEAMRKLMNLRMKPVTPVRTHMLEVMGVGFLLAIIKFSMQKFIVYVKRKRGYN